MVNCLHLQEDKFCIITDSKSALYLIKKQEPDHYWFRIKEIILIRSLSRVKEKQVQFQWVPSHCGIDGNEMADRIAKQAANMSPTFLPQYSLKKCISTARTVLIEKWIHCWSRETKGRHLYSIQKEPNDFEQYRDINRSTATFAARARIGHIATQTYLYRFNLSESPFCLWCGMEEETLEHILLKCSTLCSSRQVLLLALGTPFKLQDVLRNKRFWILAATTYYGHRTIGANNSGRP